MKDEKLRGITQDLISKMATHAGYEIKNRSLMYKGHLVVPENFRLVQHFLTEFHSSPIGRHSGFFCTYKKISSVLY